MTEEKTKTAQDDSCANFIISLFLPFSSPDRMTIGGGPAGSVTVSPGRNRPGLPGRGRLRSVMGLGRLLPGRHRLSPGVDLRGPGLPDLRLAGGGDLHGPFALLLAKPFADQLFHLPELLHFIDAAEGDGRSGPAGPAGAADAVNRAAISVATSTLHSPLLKRFSAVCRAF